MQIDFKEIVMNCPKCNKELNFPEDILKTFFSCPFCGGFLQEEQTENEENPLTPIETILKNIAEEFGGLEIFSEENGSRLHRALITIDNDLADERDRLILANVRNIPQKLYNTINAPKIEQQKTADECRQNLLSFGLQENIADEVVSWLANILKIPLEKKCRLVEKVLSVFDYEVKGHIKTISSKEQSYKYQYKTCIIGDKEWFAENFNNDYGKVSWQIGSRTIRTIGECCSNKNYGRLYTHGEAIANAPEGWRLPTLEDFEDLKAYIESLGYDTGTALKSTNQWHGKVDDGLDLFGFCAYPTTRDSKTGEAQAWFWTSTEAGNKEFDNPNYCVLLSANSNNLNLSFKADPGYRACVRYVKDVD
jgi:uncharacterized protein (TIGR02145 family)